VARFRVTWIKSAIGYPEDQKRTITALGFKKMNQSIEFDDSGAMRGMIMKVRHLVKIDTAQGEVKVEAVAPKRVKRVSTPLEETS
jgi:large subunit ribosomal protein L30